MEERNSGVIYSTEHVKTAIVLAVKSEKGIQNIKKIWEHNAGDLLLWKRDVFEFLFNWFYRRSRIFSASEHKEIKERREEKKSSFTEMK